MYEFVRQGSMAASRSGAFGAIGGGGHGVEGGEVQTELQKAEVHVLLQRQQLQELVQALAVRRRDRLRPDSPKRSTNSSKVGERCVRTLALNTNAWPSVGWQAIHVRRGRRGVSLTRPRGRPAAGLALGEAVLEASSGTLRFTRPAKNQCG